MPLRGGGRRLMAKTILNFHFDYLITSLSESIWQSLRCCRNRGAMNVRFSKWIESANRGFINLYLWHSMWFYPWKLLQTIKLWNSLILHVVWALDIQSYPKVGCHYIVWFNMRLKYWDQKNQTDLQIWCKPGNTKNSYEGSN